MRYKGVIKIKTFRSEKLIISVLILFLACILLSGAVSAGNLANSPQPKYQHDIKNTGQSEYKGPQTNTTKWKLKTLGPGGTIETSPTIGSDGTIYFGSSNNFLYAVKPDGSIKWTYLADRGGKSFKTSPLIGNDGTIYVGNTNGYLIAIDTITPGLPTKWEYKTGGLTTSSPTFMKTKIECIIFGSTDNYVYMIKPDGKLWDKYKLKGSITSSIANGPYKPKEVLSTGNTAYIQCDDGYLYAYIDRYNHPAPNYDYQLWKYDIGKCISFSPAIGSDGTIYATNSNGNLYAITPEGKLKWKYATNTPAPTSSPAISSDGTIYFASSGVLLHAIDPNGHSLWDFTADSTISSPPSISSDGTIYFGTNGGVFYALNHNGKLIWKYKTNSIINLSPAINSDGTIYFASGEYLYAIADPQQIGDPNEESNNGPNNWSNNYLNTNKSVNAAIVKMQNTGTPITPLILGILIILGGLTCIRRK